MSQDAVQALLDLVAVNSFYISVLEQKLQFAVPLPIEAKSPDRNQAEQSIAILHRWLAVLDFAIAPITIRDALKGELPPETAVALLRYYVGKQSHEETDRDKADCVATFMFRESDLAKTPIPATSDRYHFIMQNVGEFQKTLTQTLGEVEIPEMTPEAGRMLKEFEFLHQEVDDFRTFDQLMDSGIVKRVRDLKQSFGAVFYHPSVLANVAVYNAMFGKRFDQLFHMTTEAIKNFAATVQDEGASIMSKLDEGVIVKHLADVEGHRIIQQEYGKAQENFRQISHFKKVMDKNQKGRPPARPSSANVAAPAPAPAVAAPRTAAASASAAAAKAASTLSIFDQMAGGNNIEDGKIRVLLDLMKQSAKSAEKSSLVVQLPNAQMPLTIAEAEALRADFGSEKSFRADYALTMGYLLAMIARLTVEHQAWVQKQASAHLWKPHTDAIGYVVNTSGNAMRTANEILKMAEQRGLADKANALKATITRLQVAMETTTAAVKSGVAR